MKVKKRYPTSYNRRKYCIHRRLSFSPNDILAPLKAKRIEMKKDYRSGSVLTRVGAFHYPLNDMSAQIGFKRIHKVAYGFMNMIIKRGYPF